MAGLVSKALTLSGGREQLNAEKVQALLAEWTIKDPTSICLSNKSFSVEAAEQVAVFLASIEGELRTADISDVIASRPEEEALQALRVLCAALKRFHLVEVNLSDNALGEKGIDACKDVLMGAHLERLYLCNNGLSAEAMAFLAELLFAADAPVPPLNTLHFYNNMSGDGGAKAAAKIFSRLPGLQDLRYSATRASAEGCAALAQAIAAVPVLRRLDLSDNSFGVKATGLLAQGLLVHQEVLETCNLRDDGLAVDALIVSLSDACFTALYHLDLAGNDLNSTQCIALAAWLPSAMPALAVLLLDDNDLEADGTRALAKAIPAMKAALRVLSCNTCAIPGAAAVRLTKALCRSKGFERLELNGNALSAAALGEVRRLLAIKGKLLGEMDENDEDGEDEEEEEEEEEERVSSEEGEEDEEDGIDTAETDALADALAAAQI